MSQMNPKEFVQNTAYSVQLPYISRVVPLMRIFKLEDDVTFKSFY